MPVMRPPKESKNVKYGCVYVDDSILVQDHDVASLESEGWELVYVDDLDIGEPEEEEQE